jgi:hypothetical protein
MRLYADEPHLNVAWTQWARRDRAPFGFRYRRCAGEKLTIDVFAGR